TAQEEITAILNAGYQLLHAIENDYHGRTKAGDFDENREMTTYEEVCQEWVKEAQKGLKDIFPTALEANYFATQEVLPRLSMRGMNQRVGELTDCLPRYFGRLKQIL